MRPSKDEVKLEVRGFEHFNPSTLAHKKPYTSARVKTVLSRCLLGAVIAPGLPRESCNRGRWASVSGHALVPRTDALCLRKHSTKPPLKILLSGRWVV